MHLKVYVPRDAPIFVLSALESRTKLDILCKKLVLLSICCYSLCANWNGKTREKGVLNWNSGQTTGNRETRGSLTEEVKIIFVQFMHAFSRFYFCSRESLFITASVIWTVLIFFPSNKAWKLNVGTFSQEKAECIR